MKKICNEQRKTRIYTQKNHLQNEIKIRVGGMAQVVEQATTPEFNPQFSPPSPLKNNFSCSLNIYPYIKYLNVRNCSASYVPHRI
jgi:hypothetical protein